MSKDSGVTMHACALCGGPMTGSFLYHEHKDLCDLFRIEELARSQRKDKEIKEEAYLLGRREGQMAILSDLKQWAIRLQKASEDRGIYTTALVYGGFVTHIETLESDLTQDLEDEEGED